MPAKLYTPAFITRAGRKQVPNYLSYESLPKTKALVRWHNLLEAGKLVGFSMALKPAPPSWIIDLSLRDRFYLKTAQAHAEIRLRRLTDNA